MSAQVPTGRREADQLLLLLLRENGCSVPKGISSVGQLSSDVVIEAVGSLVPGIDGSSPLPESKSTRGLHPADRHRACLAVASRVRETGYPEPLLAHHLLYPAEGSTRQLLLSLLNMLPPDGAPPLPPSVSSSGNEILSTSGTAEVQGNNLLCSDLAKGEGVEVSKSQDKEAQEPGESGEARKEGAVVEAGGTAEDGADFGKERDATSAQEPGESRDVEGVEEEAVNPNTQRIADEQDESKGGLESEEAAEGGHISGALWLHKQGDGGEEKEGERQDASREPRDEDSAAEFDGRTKAVGPSSGELRSAESGVGDSAGGQPYEPEKGAFVPDTEVPVEGPGRVETGNDNGGIGGWMQQQEQQQQQHDEHEREDNIFGGHARLEARVGGGKDASGGGAAASSVEEGGAETTGGLEEFDTVLSKKDVHEAGPREDQDVIAPTPGDEGLSRDDRVDGGDPGAPSSVAREQRVGETSTESGPAGTAPGARPTAEETAEDGCDAADAEGAAKGMEGVAPEEYQSVGENAARSREKSEEELEAPRGAGAEVTIPSAESMGVGESVVGEQEVAGEDSGEEDVAFLQFEVEAQELELKRLLREKETASKASNELEEEVRRLGALTEERETHCRYAAKALELLPNAADETSRLQREIEATELRMQAAQKAFAKTRKPLEERVRVQKEELARRKARCRDLLTEIRSTYDETEQISRQETLLKAIARDMDMWERRKRGEIIIGFEEGEESSENDWSKGVMEEDEDNQRRRKAGALLRADIDARITNLCDEALAQKQEIAISVSEVLDSRRETNAAWDLLGRSEALAEDKLFSASKEALLSNKDRARDLIQAYKRLHAMDDVFSNLVEAVSRVTKREEECHLLEDETARIVSQQGGSSLMQLLVRDLKRVRKDAFALEQRLDEVLEEQRLQQEARQEVERLEQEQKATEEQAVSEVMEERVKELEEGRDDATSPQELDVPDAVASEERQEEEGDEPKGLDGEERGEESGATGFDHPEGIEEPRDVEVDFVGDEEEENVWQ